MGLFATKNNVSTHQEHVSEVTQDAATVDRNIHHPKGWMNWRVFVYSESCSCSSSLFDVRILSNVSFLVVIVGLSMGLYGYDNNFVAPLLSLPLFIQRYQGSGIVFTVCGGL